MGHIRLPKLPKTQKWEQVVGLIAGGADVERIAAASADAAEHGLERASDDQGLAHAFWLLTQIPQAARQSDFADQLKRLGLEISSKPTLLEIVGAFTNAVDRYVSTRGNRSDLGTTLVRFDSVHNGHFKCNLRRLIDYPNLWGYARELYQVPGVSGTVNMIHIKPHYYMSHPTINPTRIVSKGPAIDFSTPHDRVRFG
jgi:hypothetical protein